MLRLLIALVGMLSTRRPGAAWSRPARDQDEPEDEATWYPPAPAGAAAAVAPRFPHHAGASGAGTAPAAYPAQAHVGRHLDRGGTGLPQGDRLGGADRAGRDPAPGRDQRAPAARQVRLAVAVGPPPGLPPTPISAPGCCRRSRGSPGPPSAPRTSTSPSRTRCPRTSASGPAWYAATFATVGHASATVNLNRGRPGGRLPPATTGCRC